MKHFKKIKKTLLKTMWKVLKTKVFNIRLNKPKLLRNLVLFNPVTKLLQNIKSIKKSIDI